MNNNITLLADPSHNGIQLPNQNNRHQRPHAHPDTRHAIELVQAQEVIPEPTEQPSRPPGLILHCGANVVSREEVYETQTPPNTSTWFPMPHHHLIEEVENQLWHGGFHIRSRTFALSHEGARLFCLIEVYKSGYEHEDYTWVIGVRNSHDQSLSAGMVAGNRVCICDNLCFSGLHKIQRKHTRYAQRDLRPLIQGTIGKLENNLSSLDKRIAHYKEKSVTDLRAHDIILRGVDEGAITNSQIPEVLGQWRKPKHKVFEERTVFSLWNAFTDVTSKNNLNTQVTRGEHLQRLFDKKYPLALAS